MSCVKNEFPQYPKKGDRVVGALNGELGTIIRVGRPKYELQLVLVQIRWDAKELGTSWEECGDLETFVETPKPEENQSAD